MVARPPERRRPPRHYGNGGLALNKPGARYAVAGRQTTDHAVQVTRAEERARAYADSVADLQDAWRGNGNSNEVAHLHDSGDPTADAYADQVHDLENAWRRR